MRTRTWLVMGLALALGGPLQADPAPKPVAPTAAPKAGTHGNSARARHGKKSAAKAIDLAPLVTALGGNDDEAAARAAGQLGGTAEPAAHEALLDALAMGLSPAVAPAAIAALVAHPAPPDVASLRRYASHHNPTVRGAAIGALAQYPDPAAHAAVVAGLHDAASVVRAAAADAAAKGRVREALPPLFALLARGEEPAARALARLADAELARQIGDQLGKVPDAILASCLGQVLVRADFGPDPARVEVVRALAKIQDASAVSALTDYLDATPKNPPRPSRMEAQKLVEARLGGGK